MIRQRVVTVGSRVVAIAGLSLGLARGAWGQGPFVPNGRDLFVLDLAGTPVGGFPRGIQVLTGGLTVVDKDGQRMLRASSPSEFLIRFPQALPQDFTVAFDFIPKACCNPEDLALEGTPTINRGTGSAHVVWHRELLSVVGGGSYYQALMPEDLKQATPGMRTQVVVVVEGSTLKLYTNGRRLYTLADRKFVRGGVLRVYLGGQDGDQYAVYLAGLRVAAGTGSLGIIAASPVTSTARGAARCIPGPPTAPPPQRFMAFGMRVGGAPLQWFSEPGTEYLIERAPAGGAAGITTWTRLTSSCDAPGLLVFGSWLDEDLTTYPTLSLVDAFPGVQLGGAYQYRLTRIQADNTSGSTTIYWEAPSASFQGPPAASLSGNVVTITAGVSYCQPLGIRCDPWVLDFAMTASSSGFSYASRQSWVDTYDPAVPASEPGTMVFKVSGVPPGTHTFTVTAVYQPNHRVAAGSVTIQVP